MKPTDLGDLLELTLLAVFATYRRDATVLLSPVWHEWRNNGFNVVTGSLDVNAGHLRRDPRASIVVCKVDATAWMDWSRQLDQVDYGACAGTVTVGRSGSTIDPKASRCS